MTQWPRLEFLEPMFGVIGAVGMRMYAPERATRDVDVVVAAADFDETERRLADALWQPLGKLSVGGSSWRSPDGQHDLDVLFRREPWWPEVIAEAQTNRDEQGLPVIPLKGQVWLKLMAGRTVDAGDLSRLLGLATEVQIVEVRAFLDEHADARDLQDFESLVQLGRLEFGEQT